ncbi:hypothetical protein AB0D14_18555 [Streptomyces sp. NPDC048484]|uniref:hypothetical protein n=1 Tax=Streptomyces sp. NPDC048484 TaxID=3155146 RepID=UPI00343DF25A
MTVSIIHTLLRWVLGVLAPGTGRRRAVRHHCAPAAALRAAAPRATAVWPPEPRSPYGRAEAPLDGGASPLVRPYLVAVEQERARQSRRRTALVLAADFGIDLDRHVVGVEGVVAC